MPVIDASALGVPAAFNATFYFVDCHLAEGRDSKTAIECGDERVTYAELYARANQVGRALRERLGVSVGERVTLLLLRRSPVLLQLLRRHQDSGCCCGPYPCGLPADDQCPLRRLARTRRHRERRAHPEACGGWRREVVRRRARRGRRYAGGNVRGGRPRMELDRFGVWSRGQLRRCQCKVATIRRSGCTRRAARDGRRAACIFIAIWSSRGAFAKSILGSARPIGLSASRSCSSPTASATRCTSAGGGGTIILSPAPPSAANVDGSNVIGHLLLLGADRLRHAARPRRRRSIVERAARAVGRRSPPAGHLRSFQASLRRRDPRRHRLDRGDAHVHLEPAGPDSARVDRPAGSRLRDEAH